MQFQGDAAHLAASRPNLRKMDCGAAGKVDVQTALVRAILEVSPDGILVVSEDRVIIAHNQRFLDLWHLRQPDDLVGSPDAPVLAAVVSQVKDPESFLDRVETLYQHPSTDDHREIQLKDGRTFVRWSTVINGEQGQ